MINSSVNIFNYKTQCFQLISLLYLMFARCIPLPFNSDVIFNSSLHSFITKYTIHIETATFMLNSDIVTLHCADFFKRLRNGNVK